MTRIHSKIKSTPNKAPIPQPNERFYTGLPQDTKPNPRPHMTIIGNLLNELGFTSRQLVTITAKKGKLIRKFAK